MSGLVWCGERVCRSGRSNERHAEGATTQKANMYLGEFFTYQPEQVLTFDRMKDH